MSKPIEISSARLQMVLQAASLSSDKVHPNKLKFRGVLTRVDEISDKPPGGAEGHRINLPSAVAKKRLSTLIGMGLNYSPDLAGHAQRRKVGVIEDAGVSGKDLWVAGYIWKHDFPEAQDDLKQSGLGMSMELGDVKVEDPNADVWKLTDCCFLGGTILWKSKAAYNKTRAIAAAKQGGAMATSAKKKPVKVTKPAGLDEERIAEIAASAAATAVGTLLTGTIKRQNAVLSRMADTLDVIAADDENEEEEEEVKVAAKSDDDDEDDEDEMDASKKSDDSDDDDQDEEDDDDEDDDIESTSDDQKPGTENSDAENQGDKTDCDDETGTDAKMPVTGSAAVKKLRRRLASMKGKFQAAMEANKTLTNQVKKLTKTVQAQADKTERISKRTFDPEVVGLLAKSNINASELAATGQKLTSADVDAVIAAAEEAAHTKFSTEQRIQMKIKLERNGLAQ